MVLKKHKEILSICIRTFVDDYIYLSPDEDYAVYVED